MPRGRSKQPATAVKSATHSTKGTLVASKTSEKYVFVELEDDGDYPIDYYKFSKNGVMLCQKTEGTEVNAFFFKYNTPVCDFICNSANQIFKLTCVVSDMDVHLFVDEVGHYAFDGVRWLLNE